MISDMVYVNHVLRSISKKTEVRSFRIIVKSQHLNITSNEEILFNLVCINRYIGTKI